MIVSFIPILYSKNFSNKKSQIFRIKTFPRENEFFKMSNPIYFLHVRPFQNVI